MRQATLDIEAIFDAQQPAGDHFRLREGCDAEDEIGLAPGETEQATIGQEFDDNLGIGERKLGNDGRQQMSAEPIRGREAQKAGEVAGGAGQFALQGERLLLDPLGMGEDRHAFVGQHKTIGCALEERLAECSLKGAQAPAHGRLGQPEAARRRTQGAEPGNGQEQPEIAPLHGHPNISA